MRPRCLADRTFGRCGSARARERNDVARSYRVENLPTLVAISKEGKIVAVRRGITTDAQLDRLVGQVLWNASRYLRGGSSDHLDAGRRELRVERVTGS